MSTDARARVEDALAIAMGEVISGDMPPSTLDALSRAASTYLELQALTDLEARIEELEAWKATFRSLQPGALSA